MSSTPLQRLDRATRFFARLLAFDLECPACGAVYQIRPAQKRRKDTSHAAWDPWTARLQCTNRDCQKVYVLGILAWPVTPAHNVASMPPADQVPNPRQLAQLRKEGGGWWLADQDGQKWARPLETNLTLEENRPERNDTDDETEPD